MIYSIFLLLFPVIIQAADTISFKHRNEQYEISYETFSKTPLYCNAIESLSEENKKSFSVDIADPNSYTSLKKFFNLYNNGKAYSAYSKPSKSEKLPDFKDAYDYLQFDAEDKNNTQLYETFLPICARNYLICFQKRSFTCMLKRWIFGEHYEPEYEWHKITSVIRKHIPNKYFTSQQEIIQLLFLVHFIAVALHEHQKIKPPHWIWSKIISFYKYCGSTYESLPELLSQHIYRPSFLDICINECWRAKNKTSLQNQVTETNAALIQTPWRSIVQCLAPQKTPDSDMDNKIEEILATCTIPEKATYYVRNLLSDVIEEERKIEIKYTLPTKTCLEALKAQDVILCRTENSVCLSTYPSMPLTYLSVIPKNNTVKVNNLIICYYEKQWRKKLEWNSWENKDQFHKRKYPDKKRKKWKELFEAIADKKNTVKSLKKQLDISHSSHENALEEFYKIEKYSEAIDFLLSLPTLEEFASQCETNGSSYSLTYLDNWWQPNKIKILDNTTFTVKLKNEETHQWRIVKGTYAEGMVIYT